MSNAVRSLGSGRGVDAAPRHGGGSHADAGAPDAEFAAVMNLAIGAGDGAAAANGGGADSDNSLTGQGNPGQGQATAGGPLSADQADPGDAVATPGVTTQSPAPSVGVAPVLLASKVLPSATGLLTGAGKGVPMAPSMSPPTGSTIAEIAAPAVLGVSVKQRRSTDADAPTPEPATPDAVAAIDQANIVVAATAAPTPSTPPMPEAATNRDAGTIEIAGPVSSGFPHRHRHAANAASATSDDPLAPSSGATAGPAPGAIIGGAQPVDSTMAPSAAPFLVAPRSTVRATDVLPPNSAQHFDRRLPADGNSPLPARTAVQNDSAPSSPLDAVPNDSRPVIEQPDVAVTPFTAQTIVQTQQSDDFTPVDFTPIDVTLDPSAPVSASPRHDTAIAVPAPTAPIVVAQAVPTIVNVVASSATDGPRQTAQTSATAIDGMVPAPAPNAPAIVAVAASAAAGGASDGSSSFGDALANHVMNMMSTGHQEATLQLQPPQLGELTVRVSVQGRDVSTWFGAAQPQVQLAVSQALDQLRTDLAGAGLNLAGAWVGADASSMRQRESDPGLVPARHSGFTAPSVDRPAVDAIDGPRRSSGVSVYV